MFDNKENRTYLHFTTYLPTVVVIILSFTQAFELLFFLSYHFQLFCDFILPAYYRNFISTTSFQLLSTLFIPHIYAPI